MSSPIVLGISHSHDCGAAILVDGRLVAAVNEERFTRRKQQMGLPVRSIAHVLAAAGVEARDVGTIAVGGAHLASHPTLNNDMSEEDGSYRGAVRLAEAIDSWPLGARLLSQQVPVAAYRGLQSAAARLGRSRLEREVAELGLGGRIELHDHHLAHVASGYFASGLGECLILSNDGFGDGLSTRIAIGRNGSLETLSVTSFFDSLGVLYGYATNICGFPLGHHAGKTTGLAARGDWRHTIDVFRGTMTWDDRCGRWNNRIGIFRHALDHLRRKLAGVSREDVAAGVQKLTEELLDKQLRHWLKRTGARNIVLTGGVHANVRANQVLAETALAAGVERLFVFPHMGDGGLALGAAYLSEAAARPTRPALLAHAYLGPNFDDAQCRKALEGRRLPFERPENLSETIGARLADGAIIARCDGAMEYGPRALGNRSILYRATDPTANDWLNKRLGRSEFMPFAPVLRVEDAEDYLKGFAPIARASAEFMTITYLATERCRKEAPACVHVDGTMRPQILRREVNPGYYDILSAYRRRTGHAVLVNTSYNMHEEPIVCSPEDAVRAFEQSAIDHLALGPYLASLPSSR